MDTSNFKEVFESPKVKALTAQVAALELEVVRLREALTAMVAYAREDGCGLKIADESLSTPFTTTALNDLVEEVEKRTIERCASFVDDSCTYGDTHILVKAVRALPTGQIKLEELI